jgi:outer membrane protein OmpA-like peptidoglycan-associated protein
MQVSQAGNQSIWKQVYQDALFELDQTRLKPKLEAALKAVQDRLLEVRSDPADRRELMELEDAKRTIGFLRKQELEEI